MKLSREKLQAEAEATGFRPDTLEKVLHLLVLLDGFRSHPFLKGRLALKGGTALNLFVFDLPRLSIDIDLNYIGAADRDTMLGERPKIEQAVQAVCSREEMAITRLPTDHAGGKWRLRYESASGGGGTLEVDINFMFRVPLWPVRFLDSRRVGSSAVAKIPVLDIHELTAGKLAALLSRHASRDLFDAHRLLTSQQLDPERLRLGFVAYGAMNRRDWREVRAEDVDFETKEMRDQLLPTVRSNFLATLPDPDNWAQDLAAQCRAALRCVLPLRPHEKDFLDRLLDNGEIKAGLLTNDQLLADRITSHPLIQWKAINVQQHRNRS
jgi:predicted nucleotidyltransferase component of viral defense system